MKKYRMHFKRRVSGRTDYVKRLGLLKSGKGRLVVRTTNTRIMAQIIGYGKGGDKTLACADSRSLSEHGWKHSIKSLPSAYLTGMLCAKEAERANIKEAVADIGRKTPSAGTRVFAVIAGAVDGGLEIPHDKKKFPAEGRLKGEHIASYRKNSSIIEDFEKAKKSILSSSVKAGKEPAAEPKKAKGEPKTHKTVKASAE